MKRMVTRGNIALVVGAGVLIFLVLTFLGKVGKVESAFATFDWRYLPLVLALSLGNYLVRFLRWQYYLRQVGVRLGWLRSLMVFMGGLTMSVTPAKLGELIKSYLLWEREKVPVGVSAPVVLAERVTDSTAIVLLTLAGVGLFPYRWEIWTVTAVVAVVLVLLVGFRKRLMGRLARRFGQMSLAADSGGLGGMQEAMETILRPSSVAAGTVIGAVAWFLECLGLYLVVKGFGHGADITLAQSTFAYAFATFAGALALIPGGLGVAEGSIAGLLLLMGVARPVAASATILVRVCTLWFAVGLGALFLLAGGKGPRAKAPTQA